MKRRRDFLFRQSTAFWECKELNMTQKAVFTFLLSKTQPDCLQCWPTKPEMEKQTGMSEKTLRTHLDTLEEMGFIARLHWRDKQGRERVMYFIARVTL